VILTPIPPEHLQEILTRFGNSLADARARDVFEAIAATSTERAQGNLAETHRQQALRLAREFGMAVTEGSPAIDFSWDGRSLRADTEAYVLLHEVAHCQLSAPDRRSVIDFGLGAGPDTGARTAAERAAVLFGVAREREEAMASLLGILWEVTLGHPALASFLDQNWLEGAGAPAAARHFATVLDALTKNGFVERDGRPTTRLRTVPDGADLFLDRAGEAGDVVLDEEGIEDHHGDRADQRARHQGSPVVDVALHQLGDHAHRHRLVLRGGDEGEGVDEFVP
jgi:hypothetical protein